MPLKVEIKAVPATRVVGLRGIVANYNSQMPLWDKVLAFTKAHDVTPSGSCFTIFYDRGYKESDVDNEVCLPIADDVSVQSDEATGIRVYVLPELQRAATVVHKGPYSGLFELYKELFAWLGAHNEMCNGPNREIYHVGMENQVDESEFVTEIIVPIA